MAGHPCFVGLGGVRRAECNQALTCCLARGTCEIVPLTICSSEHTLWRSGPVSRVLCARQRKPLRAAAISLGCQLLDTSSDLPEGHGADHTVVLPTENMPSVGSCSGWGLPSQANRSACWCALTAPFHPYPPKTRRAVCFLLHLPWPCGRSVLPTTLSSGARTFLSSPVSRTSDRPVRFATTCRSM